VEPSEQMIYQCDIAGTEVGVEILPSALKHGKTAADILSALDRIVYDETIMVDPNKTLIIGFDANASLTEVIFHVLSDEYIVVFHAMACRKIYLDKVIKR